MAARERQRQRFRKAGEKIYANAQMTTRQIRVHCELGADAERLLAIMRAHPLGTNAARIGAAREDSHHFVQMRTQMGGMRVVDWLAGEQLPRIC